LKTGPGNVALGLKALDGPTTMMSGFGFGEHAFWHDTELKRCASHSCISAACKTSLMDGVILKIAKCEPCFNDWHRPRLHFWKTWKFFSLFSPARRHKFCPEHKKPILFCFSLEKRARPLHSNPICNPGALEAALPPSVDRRKT
jgi:hypothetical protein